MIASNATSRAVTAAVAGLALFALGLTGAVAGAAEDLVVVVPEGNDKPAGLSGQVARWRSELGAHDVVWVDSVKSEKPSGFGSMAVLNFSSGPQLAAWKEANADSLPDSLQVTAVDVLTEGGAAPQPGGEPIYKISYYRLTAPQADFQAWVDGYLTKYLDAQVEHDILTRYAMYLEQGQDGRALLVLEFTDAASEQDAEPIKAKASEDIARVDAEYARQIELKESLRVTQSWTLAVPAN